MKIISLANRKGGVGKTTSSLNIAAGLARKGYRVLMIDLDPQGNLSQSLLKEEAQNTIFTLLMNECTLKEAVVLIKKNLNLIPCNNTFSRFEKQFAGESDAQFILLDFLDALKTYFKNKLDFIVCDCPPSLGLITINAFVASQDVYVPMEAQQYSLDGLRQVLTEAEKIKARQNQDLAVKGVFFTRHNPRTYISHDMIALLEKEFPGLLMKTHIRRNIALEESPSLRQDVFSYEEESHGAEDYNNLVEEILNR